MRACRVRVGGGGRGSTGRGRCRCAISGRKPCPTWLGGREGSRTTHALEKLAARQPRHATSCRLVRTAQSSAAHPVSRHVVPPGTGCPAPFLPPPTPPPWPPPVASPPFLPPPPAGPCAAPTRVPPASPTSAPPPRGSPCAARAQTPRPRPGAPPGGGGGGREGGSVGGGWGPSSSRAPGWGETDKGKAVVNRGVEKAGGGGRGGGLGTGVTGGRQGVGRVERCVCTGPGHAQPHRPRAASHDQPWHYAVGDPCARTCCPLLSLPWLPWVSSL